MSKQYILTDGQFVSPAEKQFTSGILENLLFQEKIRTVRNLIPFWQEHMQSIQFKLDLLNQPSPPFLQNKGKELKRQIERTLVKNKLFKSAIIHLFLFRNESTISYLLKTEMIPSTSYELNTTGLKVHNWEKLTKGISTIASTDLGSERFWQSVSFDPLKKKYDELLVMNNRNTILEAPGKNIYLLRGEEIRTPSPETGAFTDISQKTVQRICEKLKLDLQFTENLDEEVLIQADEFFLASSLYGIEWVQAFKNKRYFNKTTKLIQAEFVKLLIEG